MQYTNIEMEILNLMTNELDTKYKKESYTSEDAAILKQASILRILLSNFIFSLPILILCIIISLIAPFLPKILMERSIDPPVSMNDYFSRVLTLAIGVTTLIIIIVLLATAIDYTRIKLDLLLGYKKTGSFKVIKIYTRGSIKTLRLSGNHRLRIKSNDTNFRAATGGIIQIERTATHRLLKYRIL